MSNLSDLSAVGNANSTGIEAAGAIVGSIADIAGVVGAVFSVVSFTASMLGAQGDLGDIKTVIQTAFDTLNEHQRAADTIARLTNLDNQISIAQGVFDGLTADISAGLTVADRNERLEKCAQAIEALSNDAWYAPYDDQVYWSDYPLFTGFCQIILGFGYCKGSESIAATPDGAGNVFSYIYILPAYIYTLAIFLVEAISLDPDYLSHWGASVIAPAERLLSTYHDKILNEGFVSLAPVPFTNGRSESWDLLPAPLEWTAYDLEVAMAWFSACGGPIGSTPPPSGMTPVFFPVDPNTPDQVYVAGIAIEYGILEKFSGYSEMATYVIDTTRPGFSVLAPRDISHPEADHGPDPSFCRKFRLCLLKRKKDFYRDAGLFDLWKVVNSLRSILGNAPLTSNAGDWSLREIANIVSDLGQNVYGQTTLRSIRSFIVETPLYEDVPEDYYSGAYQGLRLLLNTMTGKYTGTAVFRTATNG
jgi:hypothetical protein